MDIIAIIFCGVIVRKNIILSALNPQDNPEKRCKNLLIKNINMFLNCIYLNAEIIVGIKFFKNNLTKQTQIFQEVSKMKKVSAVALAITLTFGTAVLPAAENGMSLFGNFISAGQQ